MIAAAASNTMPDFSTVELNISPALNLQKGIYADITREVSRLKVKDQFPPAMLRYGTVDGKAYQIPVWVDASGVFYNKNLFQSVGLPDQAPKTWDDLTRYAQQLTKGDVSGATIPYNGSATWQFMPWVYANGGRLLSDDGKKSLMNAEEALGALTLWNDLSVRKQVTPPGFRANQTFSASDLFVQGKLGIYHAGVGFINTLKKDAPQLSFGTAVLPIGPKGKKTGCSPGGDTMGMHPNNRYKAETWKLMEWLISNDAQVEYWVQGRYGIPVLSGQFDNKYFKEEPRFVPFRDAAQSAVATWTTRFEEIKAAMLPEYMAAMTGAKDPKTAQRDMHAGIERELQKQ
jgi:multiple sugar transport system substrate-binding protein